MTENIEFDATVYKVQTLVDQGLRVTLDLPETAIIAAAQLMTLKRIGTILHVIVRPDVLGTPQEERGIIAKVKQRKSQRSTS